MSFDLSSISRSVQLPPRIVVYGVPGIGKTTFASTLPDPIFLPVEDGLGQLSVPTFPRPDDFQQVIDAVTTLIKEDHSYQTLIIDSLDKLEPLVWDHVCETVPMDKGGKAERIEQYGYGKGYTHALTEWRRLLRGLDILREGKGMTIVLIAHSSIVRFEAPDTEPYERYQLRLHKLAVAAVQDWADAVLFANYEVTVIPTGTNDKKRGVGKGARSLFTSERPAFAAKNRYAMTDQLPLDWEAVAPFVAVEPQKKTKTKTTAKQAS